MNVLALATSGSECSVALRFGGHTYIRRESTAQQHSRHILHMIDEVFSDSGGDPAQLQLLAWDAGPGSFTGLRIGAGVCQAIASSFSLPIVSLSSLELQAFAAMQKLPQTDGGERHMAVALDARMNGIYWATFIASQEGLSRIADDQLRLIDDIHPEERMAQEKSWLAVGDGWAEWCRVHGLDRLPEYIKLVDLPAAGADSVLALAMQKPQSTWLHDASACGPCYLRDATHWKKRERIAAL